MNRVTAVCVLAACVLFLMGTGCDPFARPALVEDNAYTRQPDHLRQVGSGYFPSTPSAVFSGDLNGDGHDDLLAYYDDFSILHVGLNHGGIFDHSHAELIVLPDQPHIELGDLDGDGSDEIAIIDREHGTITWYGVYAGFYNKLNVGGRRAIPYKIHTESIDCLASFDMGIGLADVDGDGRQDLLCGKRDGGDWTLFVHLATKDAAFAKPIKNAMGSVGREWSGDWRAIISVWRFGDVDGDGNVDLVSTNRNGFELEVFRGDGDGHFNRPTILEPLDVEGLRLFGQPTLADVDGDKRDDIVWRAKSSEELTLYSGSTNEGLKEAAKKIVSANLDPYCSYAMYPLPARMVANAWVSGDVDGDRHDDLVSVGRDLDYGDEGPLFARVHRGNADGLEFASNTQISEDPYRGCAFGLTGRFKNNDREQIVVVDGGNYKVFEWADDPKAQERCGDSVVNGAEQCDEMALYDAEELCRGRVDSSCLISVPNCRDEGYDAGILACSDACKFDTAGCYRHITIGSSDNMMTPAAACQGELCLVAWRDGSDVRAARVKEDDTVLDRVPLEVGESTTSSEVSAVADSSGFWVLWIGKDNDVRAARIQKDGSVVALAEFLATRGRQPVAACRSGECLVVWSHEEGISAVRIDAGGRVLDLEPTVLARAGVGQVLEQQAIATDGRGYFVAWTLSKGGEGSIHGALLNGEGDVLDEPSGTLAVDAGDQHSPAVAFDGSSYFVMWTQDKEHVGTYGVRLDVNGRRRDKNPLPVNSGRHATAAFGQQRYFVAALGWSDAVVGTQLSRAGRMFDFAMSEAQTPVGWSGGYCGLEYKGTRPSVAFASKKYFVVWDEKQCSIHTDPDPHEITGTFIELQQ